MRGPSAVDAERLSMQDSLWSQLCSPSALTARFRPHRQPHRPGLSDLRWSILKLVVGLAFQHNNLQHVCHRTSAISPVRRSPWREWVFDRLTALVNRWLPVCDLPLWNALLKPTAFVHWSTACPVAVVRVEPPIFDFWSFDVCDAMRLWGCWQRARPQRAFCIHGPILQIFWAVHVSMHRAFDEWACFLEHQIRAHINSYRPFALQWRPN